MYSRLVITLFTILLLLTSCDIANDTDSNDGNGTLRVFLTDAPADYDAVWIDIQAVRIHLNDNDDIDEDDDGWITINQDPMRVNLLDLTNGELKVLGETELEDGTYSQIRLILGSDNEIVKDGVSHTLDTPSAQQSGLKLNIHAVIEGGEVYTLLLDFDASRSIVEAGNSGKFILKPVIRTVALATTGAIEGTIEPEESLPWVYAIAGQDTLAGTKANTNGDFRLIGLLPGSYTVAIDPSEGGFQKKELFDVEVMPSDTTNVGIVFLGGE